MIKVQPLEKAEVPNLLIVMVDAFAAVSSKSYKFIMTRYFSIKS